MPLPEDVNPRNFTVSEIVYDLNGFSIAWGRWEADGVECLGMRWNGSKNDPGYPKLFGNPVWFVLPEELSVVFYDKLKEIGF